MNFSLMISTGNLGVRTALPNGTAEEDVHDLPKKEE